MSESTLSMKLWIDRRGNRVLFAEAGKDCVDFLFYILSLPLATVTRLLREEGMVGSLRNLYKSLESLDDTFIQPDKNKVTYLKPRYPVPPLALQGGSSAAGKGGLVKGVVTYMVMDDLKIKPLSSDSIVTKLRGINVFEKKVVNLGMKEAIKLLKASLESQKVLTDVFCSPIHGLKR